MTILSIAAIATTLGIAVLAGISVCVTLSSRASETQVTVFKQRDVTEDIMG